MNKLMIMRDPSQHGFFMATFTGATGMGQIVDEDVALNITGTEKKEIIHAANVWGADLDCTDIDFVDYDE